LMASCLANGKRNQTYKNWPEPTQTVKKQQVLVKPFPPLPRLSKLGFEN